MQNSFDVASDEGLSSTPQEDYRIAMPIYEYECRGCGHQFEQLIRTGDTPACPSCHAQDLERLLSHSSVSTEHTRQVSFNRARARAKLTQRDKDVAQAEYEKKHHEEGH
jgi:putative FmdB family regulatory protein